MVLKRFLMAALGAFGLGALVAGSVSAQQIPAPDFYGDATACANGFPEPATPGRTHAVDAATKDRTSLSNSALGNLNRMSIECDVDDDDTLDVTERDDVARGMARARELYEAAANAIDLYEANDSEANRRARDEAVKARDDYAGGDDTIYARVYAEQMARKTFLERGKTWNDANEDAADNQALVDMVEYEDFIGAVGFDTTVVDGSTPTQALIKFKYVKDIDPDTDGDQSVYLLTDASGNNVEVNRDATTDPANVTYSSSVTAVNLYDHTGDGDATVLEASEIAVLTVGEGNSAKRYVIVNSETAGADGTIAVSAVTEANSIDLASTNGIRVAAFTDDSTFTFGNLDPDGTPGNADDELGLNARVKEADELYMNADAAAKANRDGTQQAELDEAARKAKAVKDALDAQAETAMTALRNGRLGYTGDNPLTDDVTETGAQSYTTDDYRAYQTAQDSVSNALSGLKSAYDARVRATNEVEAGLKNTGSYLEQLVALREYEQAIANDEAEDADEDDLNDDGLTEDQEAANKALMTAENQRDAYDGIQGLSDDNPVKDLVNSLLEADGDDADDDGQALVKAISTTYEKAAGAADAAREVVNELTGEGGEVKTNTANIENNSNAIVALEEEVWDADGNSRIDANEDRSMANAMEIGMDENGMSRIDHNEARSMTNATNIATNAMNIMNNAENIMTNATEIGRVEDRVDTNWDAIAENQTAIAGNMTAIEANAGDIMMNDGRITTNRTDIDQNTMDIASAMNSVGSNTSAISDNRNMIGELSDDLDVVRAGVAASMALAGMPAINGRGISIGVGSFDGESAFAVGFQLQGEMASFKVGVTSASGATGASAGVGFQF